MNIYYSDSFKKAFKKRFSFNKRLIKKIKERILLFQQNPYHPILKTHRLIGAKKDLFSFSVTGDVRIIFFYKDEESVVFIDIGSHNQVY